MNAFDKKKFNGLHSTITKRGIFFFILLSSIIILSLSVYAADAAGTTYSAKTVSPFPGDKLTGTSYNAIVGVGIPGTSSALTSTNYIGRVGFVTNALYDSNINVDFNSHTNNQVLDSNSFTLTWRLLPANTLSDVKQFWISDGGTTWTSTYQEMKYSFTNVQNGIHSFFVRITNWQDLNVHTKQIDLNINYVAPVVTVNTGAVGLGLGGASGMGPTKSELPKESIFSVNTTSDQLSLEELKSLLTEAGVNTSALATTSAANQDLFQLEREVEVYKQGRNYFSDIVITVTNSSNTPMEDILFVDVIPKTIIADANEITGSSVPFDVLKADPILGFHIDDLNSDQNVSITYTIGKKFTEEELQTELQEWKTPVVAYFKGSAPDLCETVTCKLRTCKIARCNPLSGKCLYHNAPEDTACGEQLICKSGACVAQPISPEGSGTIQPSSIEPISAIANVGTFIPAFISEMVTNLSGEYTIAGTKIPIWAIWVGILVLLVILIVGLYYLKKRKNNSSVSPLPEKKKKWAKQ